MIGTLYLLPVDLFSHMLETVYIGGPNMLHHLQPEESLS